MQSFSCYPSDESFSDHLIPKRVCRAVDQYSQAVLSFMYEAGLLIVSGEDNVVTVVPDCALASRLEVPALEVPAYDEPYENASAVEALIRLQQEGFAKCDRDDTGRRFYRLSFKGRLAAQSHCFRQRP
jgi:hypothetical protein